MNLFKKAAVFTDLHFGAKSNSLQHNQDCENFISWFIETAKKENCETCFFLGDYNHHRASINIHTLQFGLRSLERLSKAFDRVYFIPGNHDLYYRDKRDIHSVEWARHLPNVKIINDFFKEGDVVISPWLVQEDYKKIQKLTGKYLFGHLELPRFYMNAMVEMPDHGEISEEHMTGFDKVFSGHFHKRQKQGNVWYMGNAFPHNFSDAGDDARGCMILEWGADPVFHAWPDAPRYRVYNLSDVIANTEKLLLPNSYVRINLDVDISYEEASFVKETFAETYQLREISLLPQRQETHAEDLAPGEIKFESVDQIVTGQIGAITSEHYDANILLDLYRNL